METQHTTQTMGHPNKRGIWPWSSETMIMPGVRKPENKASQNMKPKTDKKMASHIAQFRVHVSTSRRVLVVRTTSRYTTVPTAQMSFALLSACVILPFDITR